MIECLDLLASELVAPGRAEELCAQLVGEPEETLSEGQFFFDLSGALGCTIMAAMAAGLTMGVVSLEEVDLRVKARCGSEDEQRYAKRLLPLVEHQPRHQLLVTLLLLNSVANEALPLFLDELVPELYAILISVTVVLFMGEIIPAAIFTGPNKLAIASALSPLVWCVMTVLSPLAWPIGATLDKLIPHQNAAISRREVSALVEVTREMAHEHSSHSHGHGHGGAGAGAGGAAEEDESGLSADEARLVRGALSLHQQTVVDVMVPLASVFSLESTARLDTKTMRLIAERGHSRIPIRHGAKGVFTGYLMTKELVTISPSDSASALSVTDLATHEAAWTGPTSTLFALLKEFQKGQCHMAYVSRKPELSRAAQANGELPSGSAACIGVITLEDVIEEILMEEVYDEADLTREKTQDLVADKYVSTLVPALRTRLQRNLTARLAITMMAGSPSSVGRSRGFSERSKVRKSTGSMSLKESSQEMSSEGSQRLLGDEPRSEERDVGASV
tara:strand:+ start:195 stop:1709 length:1515 start_codon:yes stop_codon:yes gene_type:complete